MCTYIQMLIFQICAVCCCRYKLLLYSVHCSYIPAIRFYPHISWNSVPPEMHCYQDLQIYPFLTPHIPCSTMHYILYLYFQSLYPNIESLFSVYISIIFNATPLSQYSHFAKSDSKQLYSFLIYFFIDIEMNSNVNLT